MKQLREVAVRHLFTYTLLSPLLLTALWIAAAMLFERYDGWVFWTTLTVAVIASYYLCKRFAVGLVLAYKAFAPLSVRNSCRFTPTCSTYMIMAINKYGLFIGVYKGIRRLLRCKPPHGGIDYP